jgi:hypothetical protein
LINIIPTSPDLDAAVQAKGNMYTRFLLTTRLFSRTTRVGFSAHTRVYGINCLTKRRPRIWQVNMLEAYKELPRWLQWSL